MQSQYEKIYLRAYSPSPCGSQPMPVLSPRPGRSSSMSTQSPLQSTGASQSLADHNDSQQVPTHTPRQLGPWSFTHRATTPVYPSILTCPYLVMVRLLTKSRADTCKLALLSLAIQIPFRLLLIQHLPCSMCFLNVSVTGWYTTGVTPT